MPNSGFSRFGLMIGSLAARNKKEAEMQLFLQKNHFSFYFKYFYTNYGTGHSKTPYICPETYRTDRLNEFKVEQTGS